MAAIQNIQVGSAVQVVTRDSQTFGIIKRVGTEGYHQVLITVCPDNYYLPGEVVEILAGKLLHPRG